MDDQLLAGKIAVVTGAGRGIGKSIALAFAAAGADVAICARSKVEVDAVAGSIEDMGRTCLAHSVDLSNPDEATTFCKDVIAAFSHIDIIVNNAGAYLERGAFEDSIPIFGGEPWRSTSGALSGHPAPDRRDAQGRQDHQPDLGQGI